MNPGLPGLSASFLAGLLSFLSPCVLPLIPVYLSFISGESAAALSSGTKRPFFLLARSALFVTGFTLVFVSLAIVLNGGMRLIGSSAGGVITTVSGILVILLAANMAFDFLPALRFERRASFPGSAGYATQSGCDEAGTGDGKTLPRRRLVLEAARPVLLGMAFAAGWTPCVGPILSTILLFASRSGSSARPIALLAAYSLGLGLPFLLSGVFLDRARPLLDFFKRRAFAVRVASAVLLAVLGVSILTGSLSGISALILKAGYALEVYAPDAPPPIRPVVEALSRWLSFQGI